MSQYKMDPDTVWTIIFCMSTAFENFFRMRKWQIRYSSFYSQMIRIYSNAEKFERLLNEIVYDTQNYIDSVE